LDISVKVGHEFFEKYQIKAGAATLAEEKDKPMFDEVQRLPDAAYLAGGATQNSIRGFAWMNPTKGKAHYIGCVGADENASFLKKVAEEAGVKTHYNVSSKNPTGRAVVLVNEEKERSIIADLSAANDYDPEHFNTEAIQALIKEVDIFYSAGFFLTVSPETMVKMAKHSLENNKTYIMNLSAVFLINFFWDQMNTVLPYTDYVLCNEDEAAAFAEKSGWDKDDLSGTAAKLSVLPKEGSGLRTVVFTQGPRPTIVAKNGEVKLYPVPPVDKAKIVDTNGAGDAFVGGFLTGLALGKSIDTCVLAGNTAASLVIQNEGPVYPPSSDFDWSSHQ